MNQQLKLVMLFLVSASVVSAFNPASAAMNLCVDAFNVSAHASPELSELLESLPADAEIPEAIYKSFSQNSIAEALIERLRTREQQIPELTNRFGPTNVDMDNSEVMTFFFSKDYPSIKEKGFLNQYESHHSGGSYHPELRIKVEDKILGLKIGESPAALHFRPKSAVVSLRSNVDIGRRRGSMDYYGDVAAVFKSDVKKRSLWTAFDSLFLGQQQLSPIDSANLTGSFDRNSFPAKQDFLGGYIEALILGDLQTSDVSYYLSSKPLTVDQLSTFDHPVYQLIVEEIQNRWIYKKGALLFDPASKSSVAR